MTPHDALSELLARVGARNGATVLISAEELNQWPAEAVVAMKSQKVLARAHPAASVVCPGCEQECVMPVHTLPAGPRGPASFVVCDKRSDINRVPVSAERLNHWRCSADAVRRFLATSLGLHCSDQRPTNAGVWDIAIASGSNRRQMLCLRADGSLALLVGNSAIPLAEVIDHHDGGYSVDGAMIRDLVDSATTADPRYTPTNAKREARKLDTQAMYETWRRAYRELRKQRPNMPDGWYARQIAKRDIAARRSVDTIRKHLKK